ncbi:AsmA family protein [Leeia aquatica]|uniref:AsmA family protein n=1 Tax=Leeia aquatica TaxID=2725557 RepID=A0A847SA51_9NEIS|nr:AsmA family protein [Leeia aquatica]NLR76924.1 AsmA family protein [Leeia aquatica]
MRWVKRIAIGFGILLVLLAVGIGILFATFDPNDYKDRIVTAVRDQTQRELKIGGKIELVIFPNIGLKLHDVSLSEYQKPDEFARLTELRAGVRLMPLLDRRVEVDAVTVDGLQLHLRRDEQGKLNIDDLMQPKPKPAGEERKFSLQMARLTLTQAQLDWQDAVSKQTARVQGLNLEATDIDPEKGAQLKLDTQLSAGTLEAPTALVEGKLGLSGALAMQASTKALDAKGLLLTFNGSAQQQKGLALKVTGDAHYEAQQLAANQLEVLLDQSAGGLTRHVALKLPKLQATPTELLVDQLDAELKQQGQGQQLSAAVRAPKLRVTPAELLVDKLDMQFAQEGAGRKLSASVQAPSLKATKAAVSGQTIQLKANFAQGKDNMVLQGSISGLSGSLQQIEAKQVALTTHGQMGGNGLEMRLDAALQVILKQTPNLKPELLRLTGLSTQGKAVLPGAPALSWKLAGQLQTNLATQQLDTQLNGVLDASTLKLAASLQGFSGIPAFKLDASLDALDLNRYLPPSKPGPATPSQGGGVILPDSPLFHKLSGVADIRIGRLSKAPWVVNDLKLHFDAKPGNWRLDPFSAQLLEGQLQGSASARFGAQPVLSLTHQFSGVSVGTLMKTVSGEDKVTGTGNLSGTLSMSGRTVPQWLASLNGNSKVRVQNGAIKGISIVDTVQKAQSSINQLREKAKPEAKSNAKTEFSDLSASFNIHNGVAQNDDLSMVGPLLKGSGKGHFNLPAQTIDYGLLAGVEYKKDAGALGGVTVPVKIGGTFAAPTFTVDYGALAKQLLENKLKIDTKAAEEKAKAQLQAEQDKVKQQLADEKAKLKQKEDAEKAKLKDKLKGLLGK